MKKPMVSHAFWDAEIAFADDWAHDLPTIPGFRARSLMFWCSPPYSEADPLILGRCDLGMLKTNPPPYIRAPLIFKHALIFGRGGIS